VRTSAVLLLCCCSLAHAAGDVKAFLAVAAQTLLPFGAAACAETHFSNCFPASNEATAKRKLRAEASKLK
jgi:hypothetical protein